MKINVRFNTVLSTAALFYVATLGFAFAAHSTDVVKNIFNRESDVTTIAGNGAEGYANGSASGPVFLMPVAVAIAPDTSIIIVDRAAQRIRRLHAGEVTTIAGSGEDTHHIGQVEGGFTDGPALSAKFSEPTGVAIAKDGSIFVADQANHCIRKILNGIVSTFAGAHEHEGSADGPLSSATFSRPNAIAIASDGTMFVSDYMVGVREITPTGEVSTLKPPTGGANRFVGIAVAGATDNLTVVVTEDIGLYYVFKPSIHESKLYNGAESGVSVRLYGITAANSFEFLTTDMRSNVIRQLRLPDPPQVTNASAEIIAGSPEEEPHNSGSFKDGSPLLASFYAPLGLVTDGKRLIICDAGNRRIREMRLPDLRRPVGTNLKELTADPTTYRILMTGASHSFWATNWDTSIPGIVEAGLIRDRLQLKIPREPRVSVTRIDSAGLGVQADFLTNYLADGQVDLVVMLLRTGDIGSVALLPGETSKQGTIRVLRSLKQLLEKAGTKLFVNVRAEPPIASPVDELWGRDGGADFKFHPEALDAYKTDFTQTLRESGVAFTIDFDDYIAYEKQINKLPLWPFDDSHENENGRRFAAENVLHELELLQPWLKK